MTYNQITITKTVKKQIIDGISFYKVGNIASWPEQCPVYGMRQGNGKILEIKQPLSNLFVFTCERYNRPNIEIKVIVK